MKRWVRIMAVIILILVIGILLIPLIIPLPSLKDTVPPQQLADPDSKFIDVDNITVHYKLAGQGKPALVLLHGFASSEFTWREVMAPLAQSGYKVLAYDRPAFGLTERPLEWQGANPYSTEYQVQMALDLMDTQDITQAILVGNSMGGTVATLIALEHPERVQALVLVDPAIYTGNRRSWMQILAGTPQMQRLGPLLVRNIQEWGLDLARSAWHDPSKITDEIWAGYLKPLKANDWDRGLWNLTAAGHPLNLDQRLSELKVPVLVITGNDDRVIPTADSIRLAGELPGAELVVIPNCGHAPQEECPDEFLQAMQSFLTGLDVP